MLATNIVGRNAASLKYDVLSALMAYALAGDKHRARSVLRLQALITTRYNWGRNELSIGRREIARLWAVEERTVKREMARFRASGWLNVKRPAARGRVALYELDLLILLEHTRPHWPQVGPDFVIRMDALLDPVAPTPQTNVVPLHAPPVPSDDLWGQACHLLHGQDPQRFVAWFQNLTLESIEDGSLTLTAPTRFSAQYVQNHFGAELTRLIAGLDPTVSDLRIISKIQ